jgi:hypothetical protein
MTSKEAIFDVFWDDNMEENRSKCILEISNYLRDRPTLIKMF